MPTVRPSRRGPNPREKRLHADAEEAGHKEMSQFVDENQDAENDDKRYNAGAHDKECVLLGLQPRERRPFPPNGRQSRGLQQKRA